MGPCHTVPDIRDCVMPNAVLLRNRTEADPQGKHGANARNVLGHQLARGAALLSFVLHIVFVVARKQMRRIHAKWRVATVENVNMVGNGAVPQLVGSAMRQRIPSTNLDLAVHADARSYPQMAVTGLIGLLVHAKCERRGVLWRICFAPMMHTILRWRYDWTILS